MSNQKSLSDRVAKLKKLKNTDRSDTLPVAESLPGDWPQHALAFPASYAQSRLWFLHHLEPDLTAYNLPALWRLSGTLNLNALRLALADLIERHPTLRTSFRLQGSKVVQLIHPPAPFQLEPESLDNRNPDAVIEQWWEQERTTPFDLSSGLLLRARLVAVDHQHHLLLLNHHHIASDAWSRSVLLRDLTMLYNARRSGRASQLAPLRVQYHDYAAWQRQRLSGDRLQTLKDYWIPQLNALEPLVLPADHPRPATQSHRGTSLPFQITPELLAPFEDLCRTEGATLQMGLLAVVALLLHRYSRQVDFAIGIPIWGRNHPDLEPVIGFFVNTLPIRTRFQPKQTFRQLLQQVKTASLAAYDNQELPFEQIVEALNLPRDTSRNPLVQVMLQLNELPEGSLQGMEGLSVDFLNLSDQTESSRFDLEFCFRRSGDHGLVAQLIYSTDLFSRDRIERLSTHLLTLLASALQAPDTHSDSLNLLPNAERQLIESWQDRPSIDPPDLCVHQLFEQQAKRTPESIALIFEDQRISYRELNERANKLAHYLIKTGIGAETIAAICLKPSIEMIVAIIATLKAGGAYLPLDPIHNSERLKENLEDSGAKHLIADSVGRHLVGQEIPGLVTIAIEQAAAWETESTLDPCPAQASINNKNLAYVIYTSGSTGKPKGVMIEHLSIALLFRATTNVYSFSRSDCWSFCHSFSFDFSVWEIWGALTHGARLAIIPQDETKAIKDFYKLICSLGVTILSQTPSAFSQLIWAQTDDGHGHNLRHIVLGGEMLDISLLNPWLEREGNHKTSLNNMYGITETTVHTTHKGIAQKPACKKDDRLIGRALSDQAIYILDENLNPAPIGIPGELYVGGARLARGYLNQSQLTNERFIRHTLLKRADSRLYKTGDLGRWHANGEIEYLGRNDFQVKLRGYRIEPGEIEAQLLTHPAVAQAVVVLRDDDPANPRLIAYWLMKASQSTTASVRPEQLRSFLADRLPDYMVPSAFLQLEAFPLTPNGKLDRKALPAPSFSGNQANRVDPCTDLEHQLHAIWAEVLGHNDFGVTDNFFSIGGHSLAAARLVSRIEQAIGTSLTLATLFQNPSIAGIVALLANKSSSNGSSDQGQAIPGATPIQIELS